MLTVVKCSQLLSPYQVITILLTILSILYFSSPWLVLQFRACTPLSPSSNLSLLIRTYWIRILLHYDVTVTKLNVSATTLISNKVTLWGIGITKNISVSPLLPATTLTLRTHHNTSDTRYVCVLHTKESSDTTGCPIIQFWHYLCGISIKSQELRAWSQRTPHFRYQTPGSDCLLNLWLTGCKPGFPWPSA